MLQISWQALRLSTVFFKLNPISTHTWRSLYFVLSSVFDIYLGFYSLHQRAFSFSWLGLFQNIFTQAILNVIAFLIFFLSVCHRCIGTLHDSWKCCLFQVSETSKTSSVPPPIAAADFYSFSWPSGFLVFQHIWSCLPFPPPPPPTHFPPFSASYDYFVIQASSLGPLFLFNFFGLWVHHGYSVLYG